MNYTEIARKFNEENGRAITWGEAHKKVWNIIPTNLQGSYEYYRQSAELFAESVRLEERRKTINEVSSLFNPVFTIPSHVSNMGEIMEEFKKAFQKIESLKTE